jgi:bifunctional DNA-binding transcriptional regulator/antitoxin component of YhaV-PrlF toxin-antitoxin module
MLGSDPELISRIHGNGRVQIPAELRRRWRVRDGDLIVWTPVDHEARVYPGVVKKKERNFLNE